MGYKFNPFTGNFDTTDSPNGVFDSVEVDGDITLDDGGTYATTLQLITPTANRTISFPDATGTVGLVGGSSGQLIYNNAGAYAGDGNLTWDATTGLTLGRKLLVNEASGFTGNLFDFQVAGSSKLALASSNYLRLGGDTGGIQFNGDTAAANALDDYEEGTWTPSVEFGGATTGITYNARQGYYVKTGKVVHVWLYFNLSNKGSATGAATVAGLPFTSEDFNVGGLDNWPGNKPSRRQNQLSSDFAMAVLENTSEVGITNGAGSAVTDSTFTNGVIIECALCYRAA